MANGVPALVDETANAYKTFRYQGVLSHATAVLQHPHATPLQRAEAAIWAGAAAYLLGGTPAAQAWFREARRTAPNAAINPNLFPRTILRLFEQATPTAP